MGPVAGSLQNKEHVWRMWSTVVNPLIDTITQVGVGGAGGSSSGQTTSSFLLSFQSNEVNQGDALEHNFSAVHTALMFPVTHLRGAALSQVDAHLSLEP